MHSELRHIPIEQVESHRLRRMTARFNLGHGQRMLILLVFGASLAGCTSGATSSNSASTSVVPTVLPSSNVSPPGTGSVSWTPVTGTEFGAAMVTDLIATSAGFLAVGSVNENGHTNGGIWTSSDGTKWRRVTVSASDQDFIGVVAAGTGGYVAISLQCAGGECLAPASSWTSTDGQTWAQHAMDGCCAPNDLAATPSTVALVGSDVSTGFPQTPTDVAAFTSADGATWARATGDQSFKQASMGSVGALGSRFAALGNGQTSMIAWTSADGKTWAQAPASDALQTAQASDMTTFSNILVAVGRNASGAVSWTSPDGTAWTRSSASAATDNAAMNKVAVAGALLVAVGHDSGGAGAIWSSADGLTWTEASSLPGGASDFTAVAANKNQIVVFGSTTTGATVLLVAEL